MNPRLSIIIPTLNEERYLDKLLKTIKKQTFKDYEIIVADADSKDKTKKIAKEYGCKIVKGGLPGLGRNSGVKVAKGDYLLFLDADVLLPPNFLKRCMNEFEERFLDVAACYFLPLSEKRIDKFLHNATNVILKAAQYTRPRAGGYCIFATKRMFRRINGFNEKMRLSEDADFIKRAAKLGKFRFLHSSKIYISVRRLEKEGRLKLVSKYMIHELHKALREEHKSDLMEYEFGNYSDLSKKEKEKLFKEEIKYLNKLIKRFKKAYQKIRK